MPSWKKVITSGSDATLNDITLSGDLSIPVAKKLYFGGGTHTYIGEDVDDRLRFFCGGAEFMRFTEDTSNTLNLYQPMNFQAQTVSNVGDLKINATNKLYLDGSNNQTYLVESSNDVLDIYAGGTNMLRLEESGTDYVQVFDNTRLTAGTGKDLRIFHDGTDSKIDNYTGTLKIINRTDDEDITLESDDGSGGVTPYIRLDGSASDIKVTKNMQLADSVELRLGNDNDLRIVDNGSNGFIDNYTGALFLRAQADNEDIILQADDGSGGLATYLQIDGGDETVKVAKPLNVSANISGSQIEASGDVIAFGSSDERLKDNITYIHKPIDKINKIGGYKFTWNDKQDTYLGKDVGVLAQEIEAVLPEVVTTRATGYKAVKYEKIVPLLIEGIKELDKKIKHIERNCDCLNK